MAKKTSKKTISTKEMLKNEVRATVLTALETLAEEKGYIINTNNLDFGFTAGTLVVTLPDTEEKVGADVQIKFMSPKAKVDHYPILEDEEKED